MNITRISAAVVIVLCAQVEAEDKKPAKDDAKWQSLFDGKTLTGWKSSYSAGSGKVEVKDGAIVLPKGEKMTGITYDKQDFPKTDYEVVLEGKRVDGNDRVLGGGRAVHGAAAFGLADAGRQCLKVGPLHPNSSLTRRRST